MFRYSFLVKYQNNFSKLYRTYNMFFVKENFAESKITWRTLLHKSTKLEMLSPVVYIFHLKVLVLCPQFNLILCKGTKSFLLIFMLKVTHQHIFADN